MKAPTYGIVGSRLPTCLALILLARGPCTGSLALSYQDGTRSEVGAPEDYERKVRHLFAAHCFDCHGEKVQKGDLRLDLAPDFSSKDRIETWTAVLAKIESGEMPPEKRPRPPEGERKAAAEWIGARLRTADAARQNAEGRAVIRRLNRVEFENTVRDLLGVDVDLQEVLPEDASAYGFDKVGTALTISSVHLGRYMAAIDLALDAAIVRNPKPEAIRRRVNVLEGVSSTVLKSVNADSVFLKRADDVVKFRSGYPNLAFTRVSSPVSGRYRVRVCVSGYQNEGKPMVLALHAGRFRHADSPESHLIGYYEISGEDPTTIDVTDTWEAGYSLNVDPYGLPGRHFKIPRASEHQGPGLAVRWIEIEGPLHDVWPPESHTRLFGSLDPAQGTLPDAERILARFLPRAFRRPVSPEETRPYLSLVALRLEEKSSFEEALRLGLKAALCSPDFLFLKEKLGTLDDSAVASRLSYFLWSTMPDAELSALARQGRLRDPQVLRAQVERMLRYPKARALTHNFVGQWLDLRDIDFTTPDPRLYPEFDDLLKVSMVRETHLFFEEILKNDLSLLNFVHSEFAMLNERLAGHYGISGVEGLHFRKVPLLPGSHRGGVMTQAAVMKVTANGTYSSPVLRGKWVLENILGEWSSPPPDDVPAIDVDIRGATTIRRQVEKHRSNPACATCHMKMDPLGFALESFDVIGGWREHYRSIAIEPPAGRKARYRKGPNVEVGDVMPSGKQFGNIDEFKRILLEDHKEQIARCLIEKLLVYATGSAPAISDRARVEDILVRIREKSYGLRTLVHEIVQSPLFLKK